MAAAGCDPAISRYRASVLCLSYAAFENGSRLLRAGHAGGPEAELGKWNPPFSVSHWPEGRACRQPRRSLKYSQENWKSAARLVADRQGLRYRSSGKRAGPETLRRRSAVAGKLARTCARIQDRPERPVWVYSVEKLALTVEANVLGGTRPLAYLTIASPSAFYEVGFVRCCAAS